VRGEGGREKGRKGGRSGEGRRGEEDWCQKRTLNQQDVRKFYKMKHKRSRVSLS
jgi:hypothetical protein